VCDPFVIVIVDECVMQEEAEMRLGARHSRRDVPPHHAQQDGDPAVGLAPAHGLAPGPLQRAVGCEAEGAAPRQAV